MATVNNLLEEALSLTPARRADLAEKLIESIEADIDPAIEQAHLREVRRRKLEVTSGKVKLVKGEEVFKRMRALVRK